jgi:hypothetical protein
LFRRQLGPQAPRPALEDLAVVEEEVEHGSDARAVAEQFSLALDRAVRVDQHARAFVRGHDDLQQFFCRCEPREIGCAQPKGRFERVPVASL